MQISQAGIDLIKSFEGLRLEAYPDPATGGNPWTIGYGHTGDVEPGQVITETQAEELLRQDVAQFEMCVNGALQVTPTQGQFDALVSFAFNVGCRNLRNSTLLRKLNAGDDVGAAAEFTRWNRAAGKVMAGLTRRREAERDLFSA
jgi:lysozyme